MGAPPPGPPVLMGQLHNEIRSGTLTDAVTRALGVTRQGGVERFSETIGPIMNPWGQPEWAYLRQEFLWARAYTAGAVAGEGSMCALTNPVNSGQIVVVERITCSSSGAFMLASVHQASRTLYAATLTLGNPVNNTDQRASKGPTFAGDPIIALAVESWQGSDPTTPFNNVQEFLPCTTGDVGKPAISTPYILKPANGVAVQGNTVNVGITVNFAGRVRKAYPGELA